MKRPVLSLILLFLLSVSVYVVTANELNKQAAEANLSLFNQTKKTIEEQPFGKSDNRGKLWCTADEG